MAARKKVGRAHPDRDPDLERLGALLTLLGSNQVAEFTWESGDFKLQLKTNAAVQAAPAARAAAPLPVAVPAAAPAPVAPPTPAPAAAPAANQKQVLSPFVGTFYRAASPTAEPYAKEGQTVKAGDALCIIEAMKIMNEIEAEFGGKIVSVLAENGQPVEFGEPLFLIQTG